MHKYEEKLQFFKKLDMFGYRVRWNVEGNNHTHKTYLGAFSTVGYVFTLCIIFFFLCEHSFTHLITDMNELDHPLAAQVAKAKLLRNLAESSSSQ